ncbi:MAG: AraC family transcriptional regulator [Bacteroidota bacterium]
MHSYPIHNFSQDDATSLAFQVIPLDKKKDYDTSVPHRHNYYEIFFFEKGAGKHLIDFTNYDIKNNSLHFVSPGQVHCVRREPDTFGFVIFFSRTFYHLDLHDKDVLFDLPFLNNNTENVAFNLDTTQATTIKLLYDQLRTEYESGNEFKEQMIRSILNVFLIQCNRLYKELYKEASQQNQRDDVYQKFRVLLEKNFTELHKPSDYAEKLGVTEKTLFDHIKKVTGLPPGEIVHERIILEAKRLLFHSEQSAKEIAFFLGFDDPSYFNKFFKGRTGHTAVEFREKVRSSYR